MHAARAEEQPGSHVVVLSHATWQTEFAGDRNILGKTVVLSDVNFTVIGVMPAGFDFPISNVFSLGWPGFKTILQLISSLMKRTSSPRSFVAVSGSTLTPPIQIRSGPAS